ncbi:MAG: phage portal protein [Ancrocorticia sp.]
MGFLDWLRGGNNRPAEDHAISAGYSFFFGGTTSGRPVTERSAMQMTAVYSCVRILAEAIAGLPLHVYRQGTDGSKVKALDHPLYRLLHDEPNPEMTSFVFRETLMTHLLLWGNAFAQVLRNGLDEVIGLYPLMPNRMTVGRDEQGRLYYEYQRTWDEPAGRFETVRLSPHEVLHIPGLGFDGLVGYSPIAMAKNAIGLAQATEDYGASFFANGAAPGGVLEHPGTIKDPARVRESWQATFGGARNGNKIAVLEEGMKYTPISVSPEQAQFLETRKFQINEIARIFRIPPHMIGDLEKSSFSNIEQQSLEFVKYTLDPWVIRFEQAITKTLLAQREKPTLFVKFNVEGLLRGDYVSRMNGYAVARQNGWMSANDIRELENLDRIDPEAGGDLYLVNGNMLPLGLAGAYAHTTEATDGGELDQSEPGETGSPPDDQPPDSASDERLLRRTRL